MRPGMLNSSLNMSVMSSPSIPFFEYADLGVSGSTRARFEILGALSFKRPPVPTGGGAAGVVGGPM